MKETLELQFQSLGGEEPLKEETATHSSILALLTEAGAWSYLQ